MIRIFLILLLIIIGYFVLRGYLKRLTVAQAKIAGLSVLALALLYLAATGRLNWLFALISVALVYTLRLIPAILHYAPQFQRLWAEYTAARQGASGQQRSQPHNTAAKGKMSVEEAYEILGLKPGASEQDIIAAHRKLMQKNHPDRGGSDYLAAKINLAKKLLLKK